MEKKEMSFIEKFEAVGNEFEKAIKDSHNGAMIMIAIEGLDDECVCAKIKGKSDKLALLLAYVACKDNVFKTILMNAIRTVGFYEHKNK